MTKPLSMYEEMQRIWGGPKLDWADESARKALAKGMGVSEESLARPGNAVVLEPILREIAVALRASKSDSLPPPPSVG